MSPRTRDDVGSYDDIAAAAVRTTGLSNFGADFGFMGDRITGSLDAYQTSTTDLLLNRLTLVGRQVLELRCLFQKGDRLVQIGLEGEFAEPLAGIDCFK